MDEDEMFAEMMNCGDCEGSESGIFPCEDHAEKYQDKVEYVPEWFRKRRCLS